MRWISLIALCGAGAAWLQAASNDGDAAVGGRNYIHVVNRLDKTLAFYRDVFGLDGQAQPLPNRGFPALTNSPGARLRLAVLALPNTSFGFELMEFSGVERRAAGSVFPILAPALWFCAYWT